MAYGFTLTVHKITVCADISASKLEKDGPLWTMVGHSETLVACLTRRNHTGPKFFQLKSIQILLLLFIKIYFPPYLFFFPTTRNARSLLLFRHDFLSALNISRDNATFSAKVMRLLCSLKDLLGLNIIFRAAWLGARNFVTV